MPPQRGPSRAKPSPLLRRPRETRSRSGVEGPSGARGRAMSSSSDSKEEAEELNVGPGPDASFNPSGEFGGDAGDDPTSRQWVQLLRQTWINERCCPELLYYEDEIVDRIKELLEEQQELSLEVLLLLLLLLLLLWVLLLLLLLLCVVVCCCLLLFVVVVVFNDDDN